MLKNAPLSVSDIHCRSEDIYLLHQTNGGHKNELLSDKKKGNKT